jgi:hypothetical protein
VGLQEQESFVGGAELESINILQRPQGIQLLGKELVMGSSVTPSIHPAGASKRAAKIAPAWKMGHAVRNTVGMFQDTYSHLYRAKICFTHLIYGEFLDLFTTKKHMANAFYRNYKISMSMY